MEDTGLQLVAGKTVFLFQLTRVCNQLVGGANLSVSEFVPLAPETIRGKRDPITHLPAENGMDRHASGLPHDVETGEL